MTFNLMAEVRPALEKFLRESSDAGAAEIVKTKTSTAAA